jgi:exodeoxyribonuclease V alpha subunit
MEPIDLTVIEGRLLRVLFCNSQSGYTIMRFSTADGEITATGTLSDSRDGDRFELTGRWVNHPKYGRQFATVAARKILPDTASGIEAYLSSGLFKGIGKQLAHRLVGHFGDATLDRLLTDPTQVRAVSGVGPAKLRSLIASLSEYSQMQKLAIFLQGHGLPAHLVTRIHQQYGDLAIDLVREDPYRLAREVQGIGFLTADNLASKIGLHQSSPARIKAVLQYLLTEVAENDGHAFWPEAALLQAAMRYLDPSRRLVRPAQVLSSLDQVIAEGWVVREAGNQIYRREMYEREVNVAAHVIRLLARPDKRFPKKLVATTQAALGITYAAEQAEAVRSALIHPVTILTGGPGTGKSTVLKGILAGMVRQRPGARILLAAPTGRAARRMTEVTGVTAVTIHRLLGYNPAEGGFAHDHDEPLHGDLLIIDEFSMVDLTLGAALFAAVPNSMQVLLVGDVDQLPSVGVGSLLLDLISSDRIPVVRLQRIYRQAGASRIVLNAHLINQGELPDLASGEDFAFIAKERPEEVAAYIRDRAVAARDQGAGLDQITVLTPMRKTETGVEALNRLLQTALNPAAGRKPEVVVGATTFRQGDKVMQRKNNYEKEIFNGSLGIISSVSRAGEVVVTFEEELRVTYKRDELDQLTLGYACTIHKAQGSEYRGLVLIAISLQHGRMLQRNLLYTALTRARDQVVLVGTAEAVNRAVRTTQTERRHSRVAARVRGELAPMELVPIAYDEIEPKSDETATVIYVAVTEPSAGKTGWAAVRVTQAGVVSEWAGARSGTAPERLLSMAVGMALDGVGMDTALVLCSLDPTFLAVVAGEGRVPDEVAHLRADLGGRIWRGVLVDRSDAMAQQCLAMASAAVKPRSKSRAELVELLGSPSAPVRKAALEALAVIGPDQSYRDPLNELLMREESVAIRTLAERLLKLVLGSSGR